MEEKEMTWPDAFTPIPTEKSYLKCDMCGKKLEHWIKNTQAVWCRRCTGKFCIDCWVKHRIKEEEEEEE